MNKTITAKASRLFSETSSEQNKSQFKEKFDVVALDTND